MDAFNHFRVVGQHDFDRNFLRLKSQGNAIGTCYEYFTKYIKTGSLS